MNTTMTVPVPTDTPQWDLPERRAFRYRLEDLAC